MAPPALVTAPEIAELLGLRDAQQVLDLRLHRLGFPQPVGRRRRSLVWLRSEIDDWAVVALNGTSKALLNGGDHLPVTEPSSSRDTAETLRP